MLRQVAGHFLTELSTERGHRRYPPSALSWKRSLYIKTQDWLLDWLQCSNPSAIAVGWQEGCTGACVGRLKGTVKHLRSCAQTLEGQRDYLLFFWAAWGWFFLFLEYITSQKETQLENKSSLQNGMCNFPYPKFLLIFLFFKYTS